MTPVAICDTQGSLQARKTCITPYKCPETLVWVYMEVLQSLVPMPIGFCNKPILFSLFSQFSIGVIFGETLAKKGVEQYSQMSWRASQLIPAICWLAETSHPWSQPSRQRWGLEKVPKTCINICKRTRNMQWYWRISSRSFRRLSLIVKKLQCNICF